MELNVEQIARIAHETNRAYCDSIGDGSQLPWDTAAQWQRYSAIKGVEYALANPGASPSAQHEAWMQDKLTEGWKWGPLKNPETREHPCLVPYNELPAEQRMKDYLFVAVVGAFLEGLPTEGRPRGVI